MVRGPRSIIDSHAHAWPVWPYEPAVPDATSRGSAEHLLYEMERVGVDGAVLIGAAIDRNGDNNAYLLAKQRAHPERFCAFPDFASYWLTEGGDLPAEMARMIDGHAIRGVSTYLDPAESGQRLCSTGLDEALAVAESTRMILSIALRPHQAEAVGRAAASHPELTVLCHHLAGITARIRQPLAEQWAQVRPLAALPNVFIKMSGIPYLTDRPWGYPFTEVRDLIREFAEAFGAARLVWGSNAPVIDGLITYRQSVELVNELIADENQRTLILGGTMRRLLAGSGPG